MKTININYKQLVFTVILCVLYSCTTTSKLNYENSFWASLESERTNLYTADNLSALVYKEIQNGSVLFFHEKQGDFYKVYTKNPMKISSKERLEDYQFYIYKPKYKRLTSKYRNKYGLVYECPYDPNRTYITGERGGCYYINKNGSKTYVNRKYCHSVVYKKDSSTYRTKSTSKKNCSTVQCSGTTKRGTRCKNKTTNCSGRCHLH